MMLAQPIASNPANGNLEHKLFQRHCLRMVHSCLLTLVTLYLLVSYPMAMGPLMTLYMGAMVAEWLPPQWRKMFIPEIILLTLGLSSYLWTIHIDKDLGNFFSVTDPQWAFAGWIRMVLVFWALIPSRLGMARVFAALVVGELLLISGFTAVGSWYALALLPLALLALALDEWLRSLGRHNDLVSVGRAQKRSPWGSVLPLALILGLGAFFAGSSIISWRDSRVNDAEEQQLGTPLEQSQDLTTSIGLGDESFSDQDPTLTARLILDQQQVIPSSMVYLRALTTPLLYLDGDAVRWRSHGQPSARFSDIPLLHNGHDPAMAVLFRQRGSGDMVLRPDHSALVEMHGMLTDNDGNLYRRRLGEFPRRYLVDLGSDRSPRASFEDQSRQHYVQLPEEVAQLVREEIPDIERWRNMSAPVAASSIRDWLHARCDYALHDLADPLPGRAGDLRAFLFGNERQRRGHCQYFTTASVVLMRASGHPARPVLGYASDEFGENEITFRALHAHAWGEFLRSNDGLWQRFDTTPAGGLAQRSDGVDLHQEDEWEDQAFAPEQDPEEELAAAVAMRQWWWWLLLAVPGFLGLILIIRHLRRLQAIDPHQRCMAKHRNELLRCAQDCGVSIEASTTLSSIAEELSQASGVDLNQTLRQHLAARFGSGPLPEPWPIKEIRQAYAQRQQRRPDSPESA